ncbi:MAG: helix-turn-helix domain-containing protein [Stenomitos rutilans HA7619-LM2]|jgi:transcriptional regulator with XRE-family HTH domain|nr:helix-turn-helix domain-containing protein [Stenomitos rutilans HA7619-LM2]
MRSQPKSHRLQQLAIAQFVRELRAIMQLSQEKFADELGMTFATINRWENGRATLSPLALKQIDTLLNQLAQAPNVTLRERSQALRGKYFLAKEANA